MDNRLKKLLLCLVGIVLIIVIVVLIILKLFFNKKVENKKEVDYAIANNISDYSKKDPKSKSVDNKNLFIDLFNKKEDVNKDLTKVNFERIISAVKEKATEYDRTLEIKVKGFEPIRVKLLDGASDKAINKLIEAITKGYYNGAEVLGSQSNVLTIGSKEIANLPLWTDDINDEKSQVILPIRGTIVTNTVLNNGQKTGGNISFIVEKKEVDDYKILEGRNYPKQAIEAFKKEGGTIRGIFSKEVVLGYVYEGMDQVDKIREFVVKEGAKAIMGNPYETLNIEYIKVNEAKEY